MVRRQTVLRSAVVLVLGVVSSWGAAQRSSADLAAATSAMSAGVTAAKAGNLPEALADFRRAVKLEPQVSTGHAAVGGVLLSMGQVQEAAAELKVAHRLAPKDVMVDMNLGNAEVSLGHYEEAAKLFGQALGSGTPPQFSAQDSIAYATALTATGDTAGAEAVLRKAVSLTPDSAELYDALGTVLAKREVMEEASSQFRRAIRLRPFADAGAVSPGRGTAGHE